MPSSVVLHPQAFAHPSGYRELVPVHARAVLDQVRIIDVREPDEYAGELGHIAGAELVPLASLPATAGDWDRHQPVLVVCRSGGRSGRAASWLVSSGFTSVINLAGGMIGWNEHRLPSCACGHRGVCRTDAP